MGNLVKLGPRHNHTVYQPSLTDGSARELPPEPEPEADAVSWYQAALLGLWPRWVAVAAAAKSKPVAVDFVHAGYGGHERNPDLFHTP